MTPERPERTDVETESVTKMLPLQPKAAAQAVPTNVRQVGHYQVLSRLGAGGMGEVYLAQDTLLDRKVALKFLSPVLESDPVAKKRLLREAKSAAALDHPFICKIYETGESDGKAFIAMEYVEGQTLKQRSAQGSLSLGEILKLATEMAEALEIAHKKGVVHRDLKPANIMLTEQGHVKVMDFGLAKHLGDASSGQQAQSTDLTGKGMTLGTLAYMAPEQVRGQAVEGRSDIFSFGVMLYEMVAGAHPFQKESAIETAHAILHDTPAPLARPTEEVPAQLQKLVRRMLAKAPEDRYPSFREVEEELDEWRATLSSSQAAQPAKPALKQMLKRPLIAIPAALALVAALGLGGWLVARYAKTRWAREQALPEIARLIKEDNYSAAFALAQQAQPFLSNDPVFSQLWPEMSKVVSINTTPPGADVYGKEYKAVDSEWLYLGKTPLKDLRLPLSVFRWKVRLAGFREREGIGTIGRQTTTLNFLPLYKDDAVPPEMVHVTGATIAPNMANLELAPVELKDYALDKYEVTNKQFKEFVVNGGYQKREYWKQSFSKNGRTLTWEEASREFRDATGRPGPATWELGDYPASQDDYPVRGISWHEAAAYAEYADKSLPSLYHWVRAAGLGAGAVIIPLSNFGGGGPARAGARAGLGPFGTYDMAGNVKEWCWNESGNKRALMGGAWDEPDYMFNLGDAQDAFDRSPNLGFRCMRYLNQDAPNALALGPLPTLSRDFVKQKPVSDDVFRVYASLSSYDRTELNPKLEEVDEKPEQWVRQKVSFDAAYGNERVIAHLFLPKNATPPYQTVIFFPGSGSFINQTWLLQKVDSLSYILKSGRAFVVPVYKGSAERKDGFEANPPYTTTAWRDHAMQWSKDLGRSLDYLENRQDIDREKLSYLGESLGASFGILELALENRLKAGIFLSGGLTLHPVRPEIDTVNYAPRIKIPILILNGRYDNIFPLEAAQYPLFRLLGTPEKDKRHVIFEAAHSPLPRNQTIKEILDWLDRYLGPVKMK